MFPGLNPNQLELVRSEIETIFGQMSDKMEQRTEAIFGSKLKNASDQNKAPLDAHKNARSAIVDHDPARLSKHMILTEKGYLNNKLKEKLDHTNDRKQALVDELRRKQSTIGARIEALKNNQKLCSVVTFTL